MKPIADRIEAVIETIGISTAKFEREIGIGKGGLAKALQRRNSFSSILLEKIVLKYEISPAWLLMGTGEMKLSSEKQTLNTEKPATIRKTDANHSEPHLLGNKLIPIIDSQAAAGSPLEIGSPKSTEQYPVLSIGWPQFKNGDYIMLQVWGDSMENTIYQGDWVICRRLYNPSKEIRDGYIHVIVTNTSEGGEVVCKRVLNRLADKKYLALQSDNPSIQTYTVPADNIFQVWKVEFKLSAILKSEKSDIFKRLNNLEGDVAELMHKVK